MFVKHKCPTRACLVRSPTNAQPINEQTTYYGWDGDHLVQIKSPTGTTHIVYEDEYSFTPLLQLYQPASFAQAPEEEAQAIEAMRESMAAFGNSAQVEHLESILRQAFRSAGLAGVSGVAGEAKALAGLNEKEAFAQEGGYDVHHRPDGFVSAVTGQAAEALLASGISASVPEGGPLRVYYYHCDPVGLPLALSDEAGAVCWAARHDPWGNIKEEFNADPEHFEQTLRLPGQQHDKATGLYYNRHRFYDPRLGAYISQDPIGLDGGINLSSYVRNPMQWGDPWGLAACLVMFPDMPIETGFGFTSTNLGGHAGILTYDNKGITQYHEYGRSPTKQAVGIGFSSNDGNVRKVTIPNLKMNGNGQPTPESIENLTKILEKKAGKGTRATLTCDSNIDENKVRRYINEYSENPDRPKYSWMPWNSNQCRDFANRAFST